MLSQSFTPFHFVTHSSDSKVVPLPQQEYAPLTSLATEPMRLLHHSWACFLTPGAASSFSSSCEVLAHVALLRLAVIFVSTWSKEPPLALRDFIPWPDLPFPDFSPIFFLCSFLLSFCAFAAYASPFSFLLCRPQRSLQATFTQSVRSSICPLWLANILLLSFIYLIRSIKYCLTHGSNIKISAFTPSADIFCTGRQSSFFRSANAERQASSRTWSTQRSSFWGIVGRQLGSSVSYPSMSVEQWSVLAIGLWIFGIFISEGYCRPTSPGLTSLVFGFIGWLSWEGDPLIFLSSKEPSIWGHWR